MEFILYQYTMSIKNVFKCSIPIVLKTNSKKLIKPRNIYFLVYNFLEKSVKFENISSPLVSREV